MSIIISQMTNTESFSKFKAKVGVILEFQKICMTNGSLRILSYITRHFVAENGFELEKINLQKQ